MKRSGARFQPARFSDRALNWPSQAGLGLAQRRAEVVAVRVAKGEDVDVPDGPRPVAWERRVLQISRFCRLCG